MQKLVVKAVSLAIARDGASGGVVRTVTVSSFIHFCLLNTLHWPWWEGIETPGQSQSSTTIWPWTCDN